MIRHNRVAKVLAAITVAASLGSFVPTSAHAQTDDQDCEQLKKAIAQLQDDLAKMTVRLHDMEPILDRAIQSRQKLEDEYKKLEKDGKFGTWGLSEEFRSHLLDTLIKSGEAIRKLKDAIAQTKAQIQKTKDAINELLNKLANCGQKSAGSPTPTASPSSTPTKKKKKHTDGQTSYVPPPTATPSTTDKVTDVLKTIGSHVSIGVGGGTSTGGDDHHRHRGGDSHRTAEKSGGGKTSTGTRKTTSTSSGKTVTAGCKCHPCTCSPCHCH